MNLTHRGIGGFPLMSGCLWEVCSDSRTVNGFQLDIRTRKKIGFHLRIWTFAMMRLDMTMENMTLANGNEVEKPRDQKGYTWMPIGEQAKRERKWVDI
jgi:hypothetical protein